MKKHSIFLYSILFLSIILRIITMLWLGPEYNLGSDDVSYFNSGIKFVETLQLTLHGGFKTAQVMPGMTFLIAGLSLIFGKGKFLWLALKLIWISMGVASIYVLYLIMKELKVLNKYTIWLLLFLNAPDFLWMDNLILTETPIMFFTLLSIYYFFRLSRTKNKADFLGMLLFYITALMIRPTVFFIPVFFVIYLLIDKYPTKLLIRQLAISITVLILIITPWTIRNYSIYKNFIPLTFGSGNPLLLGTKQGYGYPNELPKENIKQIEEKLDKVAQKYTEKEKLEGHIKTFLALERDNIEAKERMKIWFSSNPKSMVASYFILKPKILIYESFYWKEIFGIPKKINLYFRQIDIILCFLSIGYILYRKSKENLKNLFLLSSIYLYHIILYSYTFAYSRYGQTLYVFRYIIIAIGISAFVNDIANKKEKIATKKE